MHTQWNTIRFESDYRSQGYLATFYNDPNYVNKGQGLTQLR